MKQFKPIHAILLGGAIGGLLDILFAISAALSRGETAVDLLQVVASGALGPAAFEGGTRTALLGLALHFLLSWGWATLFWLAARALPGLLRRPVLTAIGFGLIVFLVMRLVVLPLSAFPYPARLLVSLTDWLDLGSHMFLFALPIVLAVRRVRG